MSPAFPAALMRISYAVRPASSSPKEPTAKRHVAFRLRHFNDGKAGVRIYTRE
jgi:hypothetical protein